jgi:outer membrane protein insertion porin family
LRLHSSLAPLALAVPLALVAVVAAAEERKTVAILPVVVHALEQQSYLRDGLADMLASRLGQQSGIGVIRIENPERATVDPEAARQTAQAAGAQWVLFGSFTRFGEGASLDMHCLPVSAPGEPDPRSIFVQTGQLAELIPRLDGLAERVALHVRGRAAPAVAGGAGAGGRELDELRDRLEALERWAAATAAASEPAEETP